MYFNRKKKGEREREKKTILIIMMMMMKTNRQWNKGLVYVMGHAVPIQCMKYTLFFHMRCEQTRQYDSVSKQAPIIQLMHEFVLAVHK